MPKCDKDCNTPKVLEIHNHECPVLFHRVVVPAAIGDDETNPPRNGQYRNVLLVYEANGHVYLFSSDGIPTFISDGGQGVDDYNELENKPSINGHELIGDSSLEDIGVDDAIADALEDYTPTSDLAEVALSGDYNDLSNTPTIPTVNDATLTITRNNVSAGTFTANSATDTSINIAVPTATSDLTNDSGFITNTVDNLVNYYTKTETDSAIGVEATNRENADQSLQGQIDALASASDVVDVVGTYAELQAYDTSHLNDNDIIKVLTDETHNDAISYYRWDTDTDTFSYIGSQGPFYTKAESDATFVPQTRTINGKGLNSDVVLTAADVNALPASTVIPTVNDATLTIKKNGTTVTTFTANSAQNATADISVPTKVSNLTNDLDFVEESDLAPVALSGAYADLTGKPSIPTKTSDLTNDSDFVSDANYVHTDNNFTTTEKNKLNGIATGAEVNVQSDWNVTDTSSDAFIKNKPSIPTKTSDLTNDSGFITSAALPTKTSDLTNDSGFITSSVNNLANYYTKSQTYTQSEVNSLLNAIVIPTKTSDLQNDGSDGTAAYLETDETAYKTASIPYGQCDNTSTATVFTATVPGVTELRDGVCMWLKNGVVTSASGFTININGLGAKPVYSNMSAASRETTLWNVNYTMFFVYDSTRVDGGCWILYRGYNSDNNTIGYQVRTNSQSLPMTSVVYRYRLLFTSADNNHYVPANNSTSTNATSSRTVCQDKINPFGRIFYYGTTTSVAAGSRPGATALWEQYAIALGYSFNTTGAALTLTSWKPVYVKAAPQTDGSAIIDSTTPIVQDLPTTEDGKIYIFLGVAYSATNIELQLDHPVYWYKDGMIRPYTNAPAGISSVAWGDITGTLSSQTDLNTALGAKANSADLATVATSGSYNDLSNKPTIPVVPTNVSSFTNDAGYITSADIPSNVSAFSNDAGYLTSVPMAGENTLGGIKVGAGLAISSGGVLSATGGGVADSVAWGHITGTMADQTDLTTALAAKANSADLATVATSGSYNDLTNKPTIPTVNNATLTIQKNGSTVKTFTANASSNVTANITVPTKTSDLTNDSGYLTTVAWGDVTGKPTFATVATSGSYNDLSNKPTIPAAQVNADWDAVSGVAEILNKPTLATVATSGSYNDLSNKPTIPAAQVNSDWNAVSGKAQILNKPTLATVATSGSYNDLSNKPTIPAAQVQSDWTQATTTAVDYIKNKPTLATVATSGSYNDLSNKPTIPTVNNATLTIQKNGATVKTFTANASSNVTANITVPTKTSDLTNDSGFLDSVAWGDVTGKPTFATVATSGSYNDLSNKPTIPTVNNATLTIQKNGTNVQTFTANSSSNKTANITVPTTVAELSDASDYATTTDLAGKQDTLTAGDHIDITGSTIKAEGYVHSENPQAAAAASSTITGSMMASGTITADKLAPGATVQLTLSSSDIGEGAPLAANTLYGVYI